jgi:hypothetical protein
VSAPDYSSATVRGAAAMARDACRNDATEADSVDTVGNDDDGFGYSDYEAATDDVIDSWEAPRAEAEVAA